jgi:hypothetical protein
VGKFCETVNEELHIDILPHLMDTIRRKYPKMEYQQLVSTSRQCSSTPVGFDQGFINQGKYENTGAYPILP